jgi:hypothetical protein
MCQHMYSQIRALRLIFVLHNHITDIALTNVGACDRVEQRKVLRMENKTIQKIVALLGISIVICGIWMLMRPVPTPLSESTIPPGAVPMDTMDLSEVVKDVTSSEEKINSLHPEN